MYFLCGSFVSEKTGGFAVKLELLARSPVLKLRPAAAPLPGDPGRGTDTKFGQTCTCTCPAHYCVYRSVSGPLGGFSGTGTKEGGGGGQ